MHVFEWAKTVCIAVFALSIIPNCLAQAADCDSVLVKQVKSSSLNYRESLAWLSLVNESNYQEAKANASGDVVGLFSGNFDTFSSKRGEYFSQEQYSRTKSLARDEFTSTLDADQVRGWVECKNSLSELAAYFADADDTGATLVLTWKAPDLVGPIRNVTVKLPDRTEEIGSFSGEKRYSVSRTDPKTSIRAAISGTAGASDRSFSQSVYLPPAYTAPVVKERPPPPRRLTISQVGIRLASIAYWDNERQSMRFECRPVAPEGFTFLAIKERVQNYGQSNTACVPENRGFCDDNGESCAEVYVETGCFVNTDWLDYYRREAARNKFPFSESAACE